MKSFFLILVVLLFLAGNIYVFYRAWVVMPLTGYGRYLLIAFAVIVVSSLFLFYAFGETLPIKISSILYKIGTSWIFILLYLFIITLFGDLVRATHLVPANMMNQYTRDNWLVFSLVIGFISLLMCAGYLKYKSKDRIELSISTNKISSDDQPIRIVALSDIHLGYGIGEDELQEWVQLINNEKPDIVLIAGDIIDNSVRPLRAAKMEQYFHQIKSKYGIYTVLGNHEYLSGLSESMKFIEDAGIHLLKDDAVLIDSTFYIVGRDDKTNINRKPLDKIMASLDNSKPIILLDHQPYNLEESEANGVDLQFSGHTHRGQVWPISLITDWIFEDSYGYLKKGNTNIYVSSGIGIWGGKFRIGTQSEYVVIEMK